MINLNDLPPQIVPAVEAFASRLSQHVRDHREAPLEVHEQGVLDAWHAESGAVLAGVVSAATTGADVHAATTQCVSAVRSWQASPALASGERCNTAGRTVLHAPALPLQSLSTELECGRSDLGLGAASAHHHGFGGVASGCRRADDVSRSGGVAQDLGWRACRQ